MLLREQLGDCSGSRGIMRDAILAGSTVTFDLRLTRAVPFDAARSPLKVVSAGGEAAAAGTAPADDGATRIEVDPADPAHWTISCRAREATRLSLALVDGAAFETPSTKQALALVQVSTGKPVRLPAGFPASLSLGL
jgi:hypothetical protein